MNNLQEKIKSFPKSPGIYQFIDQSGEILYIGKAKNLNSRIKSYFLKDIGRGPSIDNMVKRAVDVKYIVTESEIEALILEAELVNQLKPKHNVRLRDDKSFLVISIVKKKKNIDGKSFDIVYPKFELSRFKNVDFKDKSAEYFGPYPSGELLKTSLKYLRKIFPYRDCSKTKFNTYKKKCRPCIYGDIRVCTAPCVEWVTVEEYNQNIEYLKQFLRGKKGMVIKKLTKEMDQFSQNHQYEKAALIRDRLNALAHLKDVAVGIRDDVFEFTKIIFKRIECYDISNIGGEYVVGSMVVTTDFKSDKDEYRKFKIKTLDGANDLLAMKEMLLRRFKNDWTLPDLLVIDGGANHLNVAVNVLKELSLNIPAVSIAKGPDRKKNEFHFSSPSVAKYVLENKELENVLISTRDESHRFAIAYYRSLHRKDMFK